ncbi:hypothetical protein BGZ83_011654 [Gryganskiella cystojenkinii]|nr:hypothetical protein BGZ83_011654 [Gryganskiella cystojenkinii]
MSITSTDAPLCVASNIDTVYIATLDDSQSYRGRPPAVVVYKSQKNPTSLADIQWTSLSSVLVNGPVSNYLPLDNNGYWCAATDTGSFAILSGAKNTNSWSDNPFNTGRIAGLLYTPSPSSNGGPTIGGPAAAVGFTNVLSTGYYSCIVNSEQCSGYLYAVPGTASSGFVLAMYNSTGYTFELLDESAQKFTTFITHPLSSPVTPIAYGFTGSAPSSLDFVAVTSSGVRGHELTSQGLPSEGNGTSFSFSGSSKDQGALTECGSSSINRGAYASSHGWAYFSCVSNGKRLVLNTDDSIVIQDVTSVNERTDATIKGVVPVPGPDGGKSKWALAYTDSAGGLYGLTFSGSWEDQKAASTKAAIIGGVCGAIVVILAVAGFFYWRRKKQQRTATKTEDDKIRQYPDTKLDPHDGNTLPAPSVPGNLGNNNGFSNAPILEAPLPPLPPGSQSQQSQPHHLPQPHHSQYPQSQFPQQYSRQFPQQYPQHSSQQLSQQGLHQSFIAPSLIHQKQQLSPSMTTISVSNTLPSFHASNSSTQNLQEIQFSSHPRPNVTTMVGDRNNSQTANGAASTASSSPYQATGQL